MSEIDRITAGKKLKVSHYESLGKNAFMVVEKRSKWASYARIVGSFALFGCMIVGSHWLMGGSLILDLVSASFLFLFVWRAFLSLYDSAPLMTVEELHEWCGKQLGQETTQLPRASAPEPRGDANV